MRIEPLGDSALLVRVVEDYGRESDRALDEVLGALRQLEAAVIPGVVELASAYTTVAVFFDPAMTGFDAVRAEIDQVLQDTEPGEPSSRNRESTIEVPVCYEDEFAPDLREVAWHARLSALEVVRRHSAALYRVTLRRFHARLSRISADCPRSSRPRGVLRRARKFRRARSRSVARRPAFIRKNLPAAGTSSGERRYRCLR